MIPFENETDEERTFRHLKQLSKEDVFQKLIDERNSLYTVEQIREFLAWYGWTFEEFIHKENFDNLPIFIKDQK